MAGNMNYQVSDADVKKVQGIVDRVSKGEDALTVLGEENILIEPKEPNPPDGPVLMVVVTDLNVDDLFGISALMQLKKEKDKMTSDPVIIWHLDFDNLDDGSIYEKKEVLFALTLGALKHQVLLCHENDQGGAVRDEVQLHAHAMKHISKRQENLQAIADRITKFTGDFIDFYVLSPGRGDISAILAKIRETADWPLKAQWRVTMYSGSYNMRGMQDQDLKALKMISDCAEVPMVDISRFNFFGKDDAHAMTEKLETFSTDGFASRLVKERPYLAAALRVCNEEFTAKDFPVGVHREGVALSGLFEEELDADQKARFHTYDDEFCQGTPGCFRKYAQLVVADQDICKKIIKLKLHTLKTVAAGGCVAPCCDNIIFLYEWLQWKLSERLKLEEGWWRYDRIKSHTVLELDVDRSSHPSMVSMDLAMKGKFPAITEPKNEEHINAMRSAMEEYFFKAVDSTRPVPPERCPTVAAIIPELHREASRTAAPIDGGNLTYPVNDEALDKVDKIVQAMRLGDTTAFANDLGVAPLTGGDGIDGIAANDRTLMLVYTDLEPDDTMAIAQLWQWKRERDEIRGSPLLIWHVDFDNKEKGMIFEKKDLIGKLMLSQANFHILLGINDTGGGKTIHPRYQELMDARQRNVKSIADRLANFTGDRIDFYLIAPGHGNIAAIIQELKASKRWPIKASFRVFLYSGAFNMKGMFDDDMEALKDIMQYSPDPLVDLSKFPFFGGKNNHKWAASMTTFATDSFARRITEEHPLLAAALKSFNDEFNVHLIEPGSKSLFKGSTLTDEERARFNVAKRIFDEGGRSAVQEYAKRIVNDEGIYGKVVGFKKTTLRAYAGGGCDAPLCDQLTFLYEWLLAVKPECLTNTTPGNWIFDKAKGFTMVSDTKEGMFKAIQPVLTNPQDEPSLTEMRNILESNLMGFLVSNKYRQKISEALPPRKAVANLEDFRQFWRKVDPQGASDPDRVLKIALEIAGSDGAIDIKKFMSWALV